MAISDILREATRTYGEVDKMAKEKQEGYSEYAVKRVPVTTTIPHELAAQLKKDGVKLSRWIDMQLYHPTPRKIEVDTEIIKADTRALAARLNESCRTRFKMAEQIVALEDRIRKLEVGA
jgi:hypothetical protein